jgi:hypothetical protein
MPGALERGVTGGTEPRRTPVSLRYSNQLMIDISQKEICVLSIRIEGSSTEIALFKGTNWTKYGVRNISCRKNSTYAQI